MTNELAYEVAEQLYQDLYELEGHTYNSFTKRFVLRYRDIYDGFMALYEDGYLHYDDIMKLEHTFYLVRYKQGESAVDQAMIHTERLSWTVVDIKCDLEEKL